MLQQVMTAPGVIEFNEVPAPEGDLEGPTQVLFSNVDYDEYVGRIGIGAWSAAP